jgi:hypothetical protein
MTTTTTPKLSDVEEAVLHARWQVATNRPRHFTDQSISWVPNKRYDRFERIVQNLAAMLVEDGTWEEDMQDFDDGLENLVGALWTEVERQTKDWARRESARKDRYLATRRAEKAGTAA